ncbi:hypothetical protein [Xanthobacter sp. YC-JY1]|uniref:hypothetical protein n=1 Tax=Xanthobacter sp. YC-JY1 TaxID=2419844 RepID=UPI001F2E0AF3|nr:hypothetical protein [Xanthobacter sp. YC-JY1]
MSLSLSPSAATPPAREATARQDRAAPVGAAAAGGHDPASHGHAAAHAAHAHAASPADRRPPVRIGASVLRMSLAGRLALVSALIIVLWGAVLLVTGGGA